MLRGIIIILVVLNGALATLLWRDAAETKLLKAELGHLAEVSRILQHAPLSTNGSGKRGLNHTKTVAEYEALAQKNSDWSRKNDAKLSVMNLYGLALESLNLPPAALQSVKNLLAQRAEAIALAREQASQNNLGPKETDAAVAAAEAAVDQKIQATVDAETYSKIQALIDAGGELMNVKSAYAPYLAFAGAPLNAVQSVTLATSLRNIYAVPMEQSSDEDSAIAYRTQGLDPASGLSTADRNFLAQVADTLSPQQVTLLKVRLAQLTGRYVMLQKTAK